MAENKSFNVRVYKGTTYLDLKAEEGKNLLTLLIENGAAPDTPCGGKGRCGKCGIRLIKGDIPVSDGDRAVFNDEELSLGMRLCCRSFVSGDLELKLLRENTGKMQILADCGTVEKDYSGTEEKTGQVPAETGIAIDLGTTTIALALMDLSERKTIAVSTLENSQRSFGADVISRVEAAINGKAAGLRKAVTSDIENGISLLLNKSRVPPASVKSVAIAGNTAMLHLLEGLDVQGLGAYPFSPANLSLEERTLGRLFPKVSGILNNAGLPVYILPGKSAFIGADILSGLFDLGFGEKDETCFFLDLGTNGEMALGNRREVLVSSAAAGPAFEGGNIKWGMAGVPGAISNVEITGGMAKVSTIGRLEKASGICGTGVIESAAGLLNAGILDNTGLLTDEYFDEGFPLAVSADGRRICITQSDIRELQLAKAAIRAGLEILLKRSGISPKNIDRFYISGGFGYYLNPKKAARIGLFPEELLSKCVISGNTSLKGAAGFLFSPENGKERLNRLKESSREISLSGDPEFNELYIKYMDFPQG